MNKIGFFIFFAIFASLNSYIYIHGSQALPSNNIIQIIYTSLFVVLALSFIVAVVFEGKISPVVISIAENIGGYWMIAFLYFVVAALFTDILRVADYFLGIFPNAIKTNYTEAKLIYFGIVLLIPVIFSIIGYVRFSNPNTVFLNLNVQKEGIPTGQLTIVAVSDVHLGNVIRRARLEKNVAEINSLNPDIILIAGDLFDRNLRTVELQHMDTALNKLKAKYGVYAVLGNHDYFSDADKAIDIMSRSGIKLLRDAAITIDNKFVLIGRDDYSNRRRKPLSALVSGFDKSLPTILLDHQPHKLSEAVENNIDLQISGHTHNGQIYPFSLIIGKMFELPYGYRKTGNTHFYVSSGLGLWGAPIRLGTQSEIVHFKLNFISPDNA